MFGFAPENKTDFNKAAASIAVNEIDYPNEEAFFKQFSIGMGMDPDQNIVLSVKTVFNVEYMDEGLYIFNVISSDGSLLAIDGAMHINSQYFFQKCLLQPQGSDWMCTQARWWSKMMVLMAPLAPKAKCILSGVVTSWSCYTSSI